jgi:methionine-rich copper-binding protein CopC
MTLERFHPWKEDFAMKLSYMAKLGVVVGAIVGIATGVGVLTGNLVVFGHARFVGANIENGKVYALAELPDRLELTFEGELTARSHVYVFSASGTLIVDQGDVTIEEMHGGAEHEHMSKLSVGLNKEKLTDGLYQVRWIAVDSEHGGFVEGGFVFAVKG